MSLSRKPAERAVEITAMKAFFLKSMREKSWAAGLKGIAFRVTPGLWLNEFEEENFRFEQSYGIFDFHQKSNSRVILSDTITIYFKGKETWLMTYGAPRCEREDLPFLQRALMEAYAYKGHGKFFGGRGLRHHVEEGVPSLYENSAYGNFENFRGHDKIVLQGRVAPECTMLSTYSGGIIDVRSR